MRLGETRPRILAALIVSLILGGVLAACGGGQSSTPNPAAESLALPSVILPSEDPEVEALLPDQLCGVQTRKLSMAGETFVPTADAAFKATLARLGKTPADVGYGTAVPDPASGATCGVIAGIFRFAGFSSTNPLPSDAFLDEARKGGTDFQPMTVGGRSVFAGHPAGSGLTTYLAFGPDAVYFVNAPDDGTAASVLADWPANRG